MSNRSLGRIIWRNNRLGLLMVNSQRQSFFIFAEPLLSLFKHPEAYARVKHRDRKPEGATRYHGGDILASIDIGDEESVITVYLGPLDQRLTLDKKSGTPKGFFTTQGFRFPTEELEVFGSALEFMQDQNKEFDSLLADAETYVPLPI